MQTLTFITFIVSPKKSWYPCVGFFVFFCHRWLASHVDTNSYYIGLHFFTHGKEKQHFSRKSTKKINTDMRFTMQHIILVNIWRFIVRRRFLHPLIGLTPCWHLQWWPFSCKAANYQWNILVLVWPKMNQSVSCLFVPFTICKKLQGWKLLFFFFFRYWKPTRICKYLTV